MTNARTLLQDRCLEDTPSWVRSQGIHRAWDNDEFGRTVYCQGKLTPKNYGRDHFGRCFTMWLAGGAIRGGQTFGETDDHSFNVVRDPVHVHDLNATLLHCLGFDHTRLTFRFQGRDYRLTDVHGNVVMKLLT